MKGTLQPLIQSLNSLSSNLDAQATGLQERMAGMQCQVLERLEVARGSLQDNLASLSDYLHHAFESVEERIHMLQDNLGAVASALQGRFVNIRASVDGSYQVTVFVPSFFCAINALDSRRLQVETVVQKSLLVLSLQCSKDISSSGCVVHHGSLCGGLQRCYHNTGWLHTGGRAPLHAPEALCCHFFVQMLDSVAAAPNETHTMQQHSLQHTIFRVSVPHVAVEETNQLVFGLHITERPSCYFRVPSFSTFIYC